MDEKQARIPFESLTEEIIFSILDSLESDPQSQKSFSVVSKSFHSIESRHRTILKPLHTDFFARTLRRYPNIQRLDFTFCPRIDDAVLVMAANAYSETLKSVDLSRSRFFGNLGLSSLGMNCLGLVELDLSNATELKDSGAAAVAEAKNLENLMMARCKSVSDIGIGCIAVGCKKLKRICLKWCIRVTDLGVGLLAFKCKELRSLDLSYLPITEMCMQPILQLKNLRELVLVGCPGIDDEFLTYLQQSSKSLEVLDISLCHNITDNALGCFINDVKSLRQLNLSYSFSVTFDLVKCFYRLSELQSIKLDGCHITSAGLRAIANCCDSLKELSLCKCIGVMDDGLSYIALKLGQLTKLDVTCCQEITDASVESVATSCTYLTSLRIEALVLKKAFLFIGQYCRFLEDIDITENQIDDTGLEAISRCSRLLNLKMGLCPDITDHGLSHVGMHCKNLVELDLYRCMGITDVGISAIACGCHSLETINMAYCDKVTDSSLISLAQCLQMRTLEIRGCPLISSVGLSAITEGCKHLTALDIKKCRINDAGLVHLARNSQYLKQINIAYCPVSDIGLLALASIRRLQNITVLHISQLTPNGLIAALLACRGLMKVKLHSNYKLSIPDAIINAMQERGCAVLWRNKANWVSPYWEPALQSTLLDLPSTEV